MVIQGELGKVRIISFIYHFPALLLSWVTTLLAVICLINKACWTLMCILILDLIPLWRSQLQHLRLRYFRWKAEQEMTTNISHIWCLPIFMSVHLPTLFCSVVRAMSISWTQVGLLKSELVPLWSCQVQYYCYGKVKQRDRGAISRHIWYLPALMLSWLMMMLYFVVICLHLQNKMESVSLIKNTLLMLSQHLPMVILWWRIAAVQSEEQYGSMQCNSCFVKSDFVLRNFWILYYIFFNWTTSFAVDDAISLFALLLLLLCGDVETNPGPTWTLEGDVLKEMLAQLNEVISNQVEPVLFGEVMQRANFVSHQVRNATGGDSDYTIVSTIMSAVRNYISTQSTQEKVTQKFDEFVRILCNTLGLEVLAQQLVDRLRSKRPGYKSPLDERAPWSREPAGSKQSPLPSIPEPAARLALQDLRQAKDILMQHAHIWKEIGYGLGFKVDEISSIESRPILLMNAPASCLDAMLSEWQRWALGDARGSTTYPTMDSLREAVDRAGLGRTAMELRALQTPGPLRSQDLAKVQGILMPYAYKWKEIGRWLGFKVYEMSYIESRPILLMNAPASYLDAMLSEWQRWAPGDARGSTTYPTMDSLREAVDRAGLERTAMELGGSKRPGYKSPLDERAPWCPALAAYSRYPGTKFLGAPIKKHVTYKGGTIDLADIGLSIIIPEQPLEDSLDLLIRPCLSGSFKLPYGYKLASPVYVIEPNKKGVIQKPCTVRIQHYVELLNEADCKHMAFFSSDLKPQSGVDQFGREQYHVFKQIEGHKQIFKPSCESRFGEIELNHFCCLTIGKSLLGHVEDLYCARLYHSLSSCSAAKAVAVICVCLHQPVCIQLCNHMITNGYSDFSTKDEAVSVKTAPMVQDEIVIGAIDGSGWKVSFNISPIKIHRRDVESEALGRPDYPPRFSVFLDRIPDAGTYSPPQLCIEGLGKNPCFLRISNEDVTPTSASSATSPIPTSQGSAEDAITDCQPIDNVGNLPSCDPFTRCLLKFDTIDDDMKNLTGKGSKLAIIDNGFHKDIRVVFGWPDDSPFTFDPNDAPPHCHGTAVAAIAAGPRFRGHWKDYMNFPSGVAPLSKVTCYSITPKNSFGKILTKISKADPKYDVVSISQIYKHEGNVNKIIDQILEDGTLIFAGAGNGGIRTEIGYPASHDGVISVGSLNWFGGFSEFTHTKPPLPDVYTYGEVLVPDGDIFENRVPELLPKMGTSMATPAAAGLATLAVEYAKNKGLNVRVDRKKKLMPLFKRTLPPVRREKSVHFVVHSAKDFLDDLKALF